jgi:hypothetical protein
LTLGCASRVAVTAMARMAFIAPNSCYAEAQFTPFRPPSHSGESGVCPAMGRKPSLAGPPDLPEAAVGGTPFKPIH